MTINVQRELGQVILKITGRLDNTTAPNLENTVNRLSEDTEKIIFDISGLDYISSAGIRVVMGAYRKISAVQAVVIAGANEVVKEAFEITGISEMIVD